MTQCETIASYSNMIPDALHPHCYNDRITLIIVTVWGYGDNKFEEIYLKVYNNEFTIIG